MKIDEILQKADAVLPGAKRLNSFQLKSQKIHSKFKTFPQRNDLSNDGMVYLDQYTGEVLRLDNDLKAPLATRIMNALPLHIGSYGGVGYRYVSLVLPQLYYLSRASSSGGAKLC